MTGFAVEVSDLTARYGSVTALDGATLVFAPGVITGLLGRNGSGKSTLLSLVAGFRPAPRGAVRVDGEDPFENARVAAGTAFVRESGDVLADDKISDTLEYLELFRPGFDRGYAERLLDVFELLPTQKPGKLSRGKRSAFGAVVGLASRAPLTLLDEVYLGMDAPARYAFYDELLADYVAHPRTIVLSSHLIGEIERLLEAVVVIDRGRVLLAQDVEELRSSGMRLTGPAAAVEELAAGLTVIGRQGLGRTTQVTVHGAPSPDLARRAAERDVEVGPVDLQDLFVHLTGSAHDAPSTRPAEEVRS